MTTHSQRERIFRQSLRAQSLRIVKLEGYVAEDVLKSFTTAENAIIAQLAGDATEYDSFRLNDLLASIRTEAASLRTALTTTAADGVDAATQLGMDAVDIPLRATGAITAAPGLNQASQLILAGTRELSTNLIAGISQNMAQEISDHLSLALIGATSRDDAIAAVKQYVLGGQKRAITIVNTEMGRAYSVAGQDRLAAAAADVPGLKKQWRKSLNKRFPRASHDAIDGQVRDVDKPFELANGTQLMYPRDPDAPVGEVVNCGCTSLPYSENWEMSAEGRRAPTETELARLQDPLNWQGRAAI